jgi:hypothetical protein
LGRARKLLALPPHERAVLWQACVLLVLVTVALRVLASARVLALPRRLLATAPGRRPPCDVTRVGWLVRVAARYAPLPPTCLTEALVVAWLLARRGVPTALRIGVRRRGEALTAHAWLERDGAVVFDTAPDERYEVLR